MGRWEDRERELLEDIAREFPGFRIVEKHRSDFQRAIDLALKGVTFGAQHHYLDGYITTIGRTIYVTPSWPAWPAAERYVTLIHERVHLRQFARYGVAGMAALYLFVPVPMGLAWFRMRFEREAYEAGLRAAAEVHGPGHLLRPDVRERTLAQFTTGSYAWMWLPRASLEQWYDALAQELARGA